MVGAEIDRRLTWLSSSFPSPYGIIIIKREGIGKWAFFLERFSPTLVHCVKHRRGVLRRSNGRQISGDGALTGGAGKGTGVSSGRGGKLRPQPGDLLRSRKKGI